MTNPLKELLGQVEKGCGAHKYKDKNPLKEVNPQCGDDWVCKECKAKQKVIKEAITKFKEMISPIYKGLVSKVEVWSLGKDEICDLIEERLKQQLQEAEK